MLQNSVNQLTNPSLLGLFWFICLRRVIGELKWLHVFVCGIVGVAYLIGDNRYPVWSYAENRKCLSI